MRIVKRSHFKYVFVSQTETSDSSRTELGLETIGNAKKKCIAISDNIMK